MEDSYIFVNNTTFKQVCLDLQQCFPAWFPSFTAEQTTRCPQQCMKQQSAWLLNHISAHPIKQWSTKLGPKSRHKAHSWAIESMWLHLLLHHTPHGPESRITPEMANVESISLSRSYLCTSGQVCMPPCKTCWYCLFLSDFSYSCSVGEVFLV